MSVEHLRNLVKALRETKEPDRFTMTCIMHKCGTPACALGQYAFRTDLQNSFRLSGDRDTWEAASGVISTASGKNICWDDDEICAHFGITTTEAAELFDADGCGDAMTPNEAADYVDQFIKFKAMDEIVKISEEIGGYDLRSE